MTTQQPGCLPPGFDDQSFLTVQEWAIWRRIAPSTAEKKARDLRRRGVIPRNGIPMIHVRTYLSDLGSKFKKGTRMTPAIIILVIAMWSVALGFRWYHINVAREDAE